MKRILAALTLLALCSCAGGKEKAYSGPDRPSQSVAVIKGNYGTFEDGSMILGVDGTAFDTARDEVEVLPGPHQIAFVYWDKDPSFFPVLRNFTGSFQLEAEAGHSYEIRGEGGQGFHHWEPLQIWAVDLGTETTIWKAAPILTAP